MTLNILFETNVGSPAVVKNTETTERDPVYPLSGSPKGEVLCYQTRFICPRHSKKPRFATKKRFIQRQPCEEMGKHLRSTSLRRGG